MVVGIGIDIVDLDEFRGKLDDRLVADVFLPDEIEYASSRARPWESFAVRFAAKEAVFKALSAGLSQGMRWKDVEVSRRPDGDVCLVLHGGAMEAARRLGVSSSRLSLAHSKATAAAIVVLERAEVPAGTDPRTVR